MKAFIVHVAAGGRRLSVQAIAASSTDALMCVLASLEALGMTACSGTARPIGRATA
ncbi:hypothetical protein [Ralstonia pseudosolanacearum]|uniref:Uncharacterized protein n=1 Tax=Ralstonia phage RSY1 TaxID=1530085 RepID=A0A077K9Z4_9CAUD|nr:hypothetical protein [Ralstonia pseudosolanacearum]YP_009067120.1 hypothetical protein MA18_gp43 [Ralstonia phage RSY1]QKL92066.1 hypothetical protein HI802_08060 [Ralstonia solanacearum]QKL97141.1 hypothetical protein HI801_08060 [Ralstonia solanacearum]QLR10239.1 hypothetical protein H1A20_08005 [Ralstonia solanacearum]BAP28144.1 hypothetical protein [Ralstonia phage RSY1]BCM02213.1 hypothetical protein MAFF301560_16000 [Ralstonia solanacearum]